MKILKVLVNENAMLNWRDLSAIQSTVLFRVAQGKTMYETGSQREQDTMDELADLGYLVSMSNELTPKGMDIANIIAKHGPHDAFKMRRHPGAHANVKGDGKFTDVGFRGEKGDGELELPISGDDIRSGAMLNKGRVGRENSI